MFPVDPVYSLEKMRAMAEDAEGLCFMINDKAMEPYLLDKDTVYVHWDAPERIRLGDIVLAFLTIDRPVVRRVVRKRNRNNEYWFIVKGDNNLYSDSDVSSSQLVGKIIKIGRQECIVKDHEDIETDTRLWRWRFSIFNLMDLGKTWTFDSILGILFNLFQKIYMLSKNNKKGFKDKRIIYRKASVDDAIPIAKLMRYYHYSKPFEKLRELYINEIRKNLRYFFVAQIDSKIIGINFSRNYGFSFDGYSIFSPGIIYVHWGYRNYGVGSNLNIIIWRKILGDYQRIKFIASGYEKVIFGFHFNSHMLQSLGLPAITKSVIVESEPRLFRLDLGKRLNLTIFFDKNNILGNSVTIKVLGKNVGNIEKKFKNLFCLQGEDDV